MPQLASIRGLLCTCAACKMLSDTAKGSPYIEHRGSRITCVFHPSEFQVFNC